MSNKESDFSTTPHQQGVEHGPHLPLIDEEIQDNIKQHNNGVFAQGDLGKAPEDPEYWQAKNQLDKHEENIREAVSRKKDGSGEHANSDDESYITEESAQLLLKGVQAARQELAADQRTTGEENTHPPTTTLPETTPTTIPPKQ